MSIIIMGGKVCLSDSIKVINFKSNFISDASIKRINRLVKEGKAKIVLSYLTSTVISHP